MADKTRTGRRAALWALFALLAAVYLITGSGRFHIVDEVSLFRSPRAWPSSGAFDTNVIAWTQWVNSPGEVLGAFGPEGDDFSKKGPAPAILAVPFYLIGWLSSRLPVEALRLSMLQTAFWLNAVVTALTGVLLAQAVLALGYSFARPCWPARSSGWAPSPGPMPRISLASRSRRWRSSACSSRSSGCGRLARPVTHCWAGWRPAS